LSGFSQITRKARRERLAICCASRSGSPTSRPSEQTSTTAPRATLPCAYSPRKATHRFADARYLGTQHKQMAERSTKQAQAAQAQVDDYVRSVAGGAAAEIERAKKLLDTGAISQAEFDQIKQKALA
jgi:hypothetical protein